MQPGCSFTAFSTASETDTPFFDLHVFISNSFVSSNIFAIADDFGFDKDKFRLTDDDVHRRISVL